jgi:hypothetical protein
MNKPNKNRNKNKKQLIKEYKINLRKIKELQWMLNN